MKVTYQGEEIEVEIKITFDRWDGKEIHIKSTYDERTVYGYGKDFNSAFNDFINELINKNENW